MIVEQLSFLFLKGASSEQLDEDVEMAMAEPQGTTTKVQMQDTSEPTSHLPHGNKVLVRKPHGTSELMPFRSYPSSINFS